VSCDCGGKPTAIDVLKRKIRAVPADYGPSVIEEFGVGLAKDPHRRSVPPFATKHLHTSGGQLQYRVSICRGLDIREEAEARRSRCRYAAGRRRGSGNDAGAARQAHRARENSDRSKYTFEGDGYLNSCSHTVDQSHHLSCDARL
jgi:hypothetical protein